MSQAQAAAAAVVQEADTEKLRLAELQVCLEDQRRIAKLEKQQATAESSTEAARNLADLEKQQAEARVEELEMYQRQQTQQSVSACCAVS